MAMVSVVTTMITAMAMATIFMVFLLIITFIAPLLHKSDIEFVSSFQKPFEAYAVIYVHLPFPIG